MPHDVNLPPGKRRKDRLGDLDWRGRWEVQWRCQWPLFDVERII